MFGANLQTVITAPTISKAKAELRKHLVITSVEPLETINIEANETTEQEPEPIEPKIDSL